MAAPLIPFGFGTGAFGTMPFGTAGPVFTAIGLVTTEAENRLRLHFTVAPAFENLETCGDAYEASAYQLTPEPDTFDRLGQPTRPVDVVKAVQVDEVTVDLVTDRPMSSWPARYLLTVDGLKTADGLPIALQEFHILGLFKGIPAYTTANTVNNRDIANPQTFEALFGSLPIEGQQVDDSILGVFASDARGDVAFDEGLISYKKRVFRRLITRKGQFSHLKNYGTELVARIKELAIPGIRDALAIDAEEQIRQEPETVDVSVRIRDDTRVPGLHYFVIKARTTIGVTSFVVPVNSNRS